jgi:hypothetical protein
MEKIIDVSFNKFRNGEHFQFMTDVKNLVNGATPLALNIDSVFPAFDTAYTSLDSVLRVDMGSVITEHLVLFDMNRDNTWSAINMRTKATLLSPNAEEADCAKMVKRTLDLYGNVRQLSYNEETAMLSNLVDDLEKEDMAEYCDIMGITQWITAIKNQNADFQELLNERNTEYANKESGDVKAARVVIDPIYEALLTRINAQVTLDMASDEAKVFIKELNQKIKYYESTIAMRGSKKDDEEEEEPPAPEEED